jgi:ABC-type sugar transport system ATPase subunit
VYQQPATTFVAGFIGSPPMNFLNCRFDSAQSTLVGDSFAYELEGLWRESLNSQPIGGLILGIRPEDMAVVSDPMLHALPATAYVIEQMGREILLTAKVGGEMVRAFAPADASLEAGQQVWLQFREEALHLFHRESEESLLRDGSGSTSVGAL